MAEKNREVHPKKFIPSSKYDFDIFQRIRAQIALKIIISSKEGIHDPWSFV
jgi:hypothetical protein